MAIRPGGVGAPAPRHPLPDGAPQSGFRQSKSKKVVWSDRYLRAAIKKTLAALGAGWRVKGEGIERRRTAFTLQPSPFTESAPQSF